MKYSNTPLFYTLTIVIILLFTIVSSGQSEFSNSLYIRTLDGKVYEIDSGNNVELIYEFVSNPDELRVEISQDGSLIAYARNDEMNWVVGVINTNTLETVETSLDKDFEINNVQIDWLPTNRLFVSYIGNTENNGRSLIGRDLVSFTSLGTLELVDFPYRCMELVNANFEQLSLQCELFQNIVDETLIENITLPLSSSEIYQEIESVESIVQLEDILQRNWMWVAEVGVSFFDGGTNELERGFYVVSPDNHEPQRLNIEITWASGFSVSKDGNLIYEEAQSGSWVVHNIVENETVDIVDIPDLDRLAGVSWYDNGNHLVYSTYDRVEEVSIIHILCLCGDEITFEVDGIVAGITVGLDT